jgi:hypothetical protein
MRSTAWRKRHNERKRFGTIMINPHFDQLPPITIALAARLLGGSDLRKQSETGRIARVSGMLRPMGSGPVAILARICMAAGHGD